MGGSSVATASSPIGTYPIVPTATGTEMGNYTVVYVNGTLTVGQASLTVTATNATRIYGAANPSFTGTYTGAVNGDTFTVGGSSVATASSPIGTYPIVPTATGTNLGNYTVVYVNGTLTVGQASPDRNGNQRDPHLRHGQPDLHRHLYRCGQRGHLHGGWQQRGHRQLSGRHLPDRSHGDRH